MTQQIPADCVSNSWTADKPYGLTIWLPADIKYERGLYKTFANKFEAIDKTDAMFLMGWSLDYQGECIMKRMRLRDRANRFKIYVVINDMKGKEEEWHCKTTEEAFSTFLVCEATSIETRWSNCLCLIQDDCECGDCGAE